MPPLPRPDAAVQLERLTLRLLGSVADGNRCSQAFGQQKEGGSLKEETLLLKMMDIICKNLRAAKFISIARPPAESMNCTRGSPCSTASW